MVSSNLNKNTLRKLLLTHLKTACPSDQKVSVLLSGGVDSLSVAFAAKQLGKSIHAYSFHLKDNISYDFRKAEETANIFGWEFTGIEVPTNNLVEDFHRLVKMGCVRKTHFECVFPFLYVYPQIKEKYVLSGWAADGYFGVSKKAQINYKHTKKLFDQFRDNYFAKYNQAGYLWHKKVSDMYDKVFITPYLSEDIKQFFYQMDWYELNEPYQKHHVREAFDEFKMIGKVKKHLNLQLESGINVLFESLLNNRDINFKNRKRMMDVYRDWSKIQTLSNGGSLQEFFS